MYAEDSLKSAISWIHATCRSAQQEEQVLLQQASPQMQALQQAIRLVDQVTGDANWMNEHDPERRLDEALRGLVHVTRARADTP